MIANNFIVKRSFDKCGNTISEVDIYEYCDHCAETYNVHEKNSIERANDFCSHCFDKLDNAAKTSFFDGILINILGGNYPL